MPNLDSLGDSNFLIASLIWGSIGFGFALFGWRQKEYVTALGGIALMIASYFVGSALLMSVIAVLLIAGIFWLRKRL